jgi:hypothetical protein
MGNFIPIYFPIYTPGWTEAVQLGVLLSDTILETVWNLLRFDPTTFLLCVWHPTITLLIPDGNKKIECKKLYMYKGSKLTDGSVPWSGFFILLPVFLHLSLWINSHYDIWWESPQGSLYVTELITDSLMSGHFCNLQQLWKTPQRCAIFRHICGIMPFYLMFCAPCTPRVQRTLIMAISNHIHCDSVLCKTRPFCREWYLHFNILTILCHFCLKCIVFREYTLRVQRISIRAIPLMHSIHYTYSPGK